MSTVNDELLVACQRLGFVAEAVGPDRFSVTVEGVKVQASSLSKACAGLPPLLRDQIEELTGTSLPTGE